MKSSIRKLRQSLYLSVRVSEWMDSLYELFVQVPAPDAPGRSGQPRAGPGRSGRAGAGRAGDINIISVTARLRSGAARFVSVCEMFKVLTILQTEVLVRPSELLILFWDRIIDSN